VSLFEEPCAVVLHAGLCVQRRLACSAGVSPARVRIRSPVAWMADRRETEYLKPIDKPSFRDGSKSPGRNESERIGGPESENPRRSSPQPWGEGSMMRRNLIDTSHRSGGVVAAARWQGHAEQLEKPSSSREEILGAR
jgi:hypothetical protein